MQCYTCYDAVLQSDAVLHLVMLQCYTLLWRSVTPCYDAVLQCDAVLHLVMICPGLAARPTAHTRNSLAATLLLLLRELIFGGDDNDDGASGQAAYMEIHLSMIF